MGSLEIHRSLPLGGLLALLLLAGAAKVGTGQDPLPRPAPAAAAAYSSAAALQDQGLFDLAADEWEALLTGFPNDPVVPRARYNWGVCLIQAGEFSAATGQFSAVADPEAHPQIAESALANLAVAHFNAANLVAAKEAQEQYTAALAACDRLLEAFPKGAQAATAGYYRGESLASLGRDQQAKQAYEQVLNQHPDSPLASSARLGLASSHTALGSYAEAEETLAPLLRPGADRRLLIEAHRRRGEARLAAAEFRKAIEDFAKVADEPGAPNADGARQRQAYCLFKAGDFLAAVDKYDQLVKQWPDSPHARSSRLAAAKCLVTAGQHAEAAGRLRKLWDEDPRASNAETAHWLAQSLIALEQWAEAERLLAAALFAKPDSVWLAKLEMDRAELLSKQTGKKQKGFDAYLALAQRYPKLAIGQQAACNAARIAFDTGRPEEAIEIAADALKHDPPTEYETILRQISAEAENKRGEPAQGAKAYAQLVADFPRSPQRSQWILNQAGCLTNAADWQGVVDLLAPELSGMRAGEFETAALYLSQAQQNLGAIQQAAETYSALIARQTDPETVAMALYERARLRIRLGEPGAAESDLARILTDYPKARSTAVARLLLGSSQLNQGAYELSLETLDPFTEEAAQGPVGEAYYQIAYARYGLNDYAGALSALQKAKAPEGELLCLRGVCESGLGNHDEALKTLTLSLETDGVEPVADMALFELAWLHYQANRLDEANRAFGRLVEEHPESLRVGEAHYFLGLSHHQTNETAQAEKHFTQAARSDSSSAVIRERAQHMVGWVRFESGQHRQAGEAYAQQLRDFPQGGLATDARLMAAECQFELGELKPALEGYRSVLGGQALSEELRRRAYLHAGQCAGQLGDWGEAFALLEQASSLAQPAQLNDQVAYERAWALHKLGRNAEARPEFKRLAESDGGVLSARSRFVLGELHFAAKEYEQAVRSFFRVAYGYGGAESAEEYHVWQAQSLFEAARCLEQLDRPRPARKLYEEVVQRFPDSEKAPHARQRLQSMAEP